MGLGTLHIRHAAPGSQILKLSLERLDLALQLLGLATELHTLELVDLGLELLDLDIPFGKQATAFTSKAFRSSTSSGRSAPFDMRRSLRV